MKMQTKIQLPNNNPCVHTLNEIVHTSKQDCYISFGFFICCFIQTNKPIEMLRAHLISHAVRQMLENTSSVQYLYVWVWVCLCSMFIQLGVCHWKLPYIDKFPNHFTAIALKETYTHLHWNRLASSRVQKTPNDIANFSTECSVFAATLFVPSSELQVHFIRILRCLSMFDFRPFYLNECFFSRYLMFGFCFSSLYYVSWIPQAKMNMSLISHHLSNVNMAFIFLTYIKATTKNQHQILIHFISILHG